MTVDVGKPPTQYACLNRYAGKRAAEIVSDRRFMQGVRRLYEKGPRVLAALLAEIGAERSIMTIIDSKLERFADLPEDDLKVTGGDQIPPAPLTLIDGGRH